METQSPLIYPALALVLTGASFCCFTSTWKRHTMPLQAAYINDYIRVSVMGDTLPVNYTLIYAGDRFALPTDSGKLIRTSGKINPPAFERYLQEGIYEGKPVYSVLFYPLAGTLVVFLLSMGVALVSAKNQSDETRHGRLLRGPRLVSNFRFNLPMLFRKRNRGFYIDTK